VRAGHGAIVARMRQSKEGHSMWNGPLFLQNGLRVND
jgi:hypothetical protein